MDTIGHHTCSNSCGYDYVFENAPFRAEFSEKEGKKPFLGSGYYFWEDNLPMAKEWGNAHYKGQYCILKTVIQVSNNIFFDLVGSMKHINMLKILQAKFQENKFSRDNWELGKFIEFLKDRESEEKYKGIFPYQVIRAVDNLPKPKWIMRFVKGKKHFTNLDPRYIICIISLDNVHLTDKRLQCE
jgi:hypothetical protein